MHIVEQRQEGVERITQIVIYVTYIAFVDRWRRLTAKTKQYGRIPVLAADRGMYFCAMLITLISVDDSEYGLQT